MLPSQFNTYLLLHSVAGSNSAAAAVKEYVKPNGKQIHSLT